MSNQPTKDREGTFLITTGLCEVLDDGTTGKVTATSVSVAAASEEDAMQRVMRLGAFIAATREDGQAGPRHIDLSTAPQ